MAIAYLMSVLISVCFSAGTNPRIPNPDTIEEFIGPYRDFDGLGYSGYAVAMTNDHIILQRICQRPRTFPLSERLKNGGYHKYMNNFMYRIDDIKLGDKIILIYNRKNLIETCQYVCINRRPLDRVPPSRQSRSDNGQWHEMANAWQDLEMHGIPIPAKLLPPRLPTEEELKSMRMPPNPPVPDPMIVIK